MWKIRKIQLLTHLESTAQKKVPSRYPPPSQLHRRGSAASPTEFPFGELPEAEVIVRDVLSEAMAREAIAAASFMRLQFHDYFVKVILTKIIKDEEIENENEGCDGTAKWRGEISAVESELSMRLRKQWRWLVPGIVSCADISSGCQICCFPGNSFSPLSCAFCECVCVLGDNFGTNYSCRYWILRIFGNGSENQSRLVKRNTINAFNLGKNLCTSTH